MIDAENIFDRDFCNSLFECLICLKDLNIYCASDKYAIFLVSHYYIQISIQNQLIIFITYFSSSLHSYTRDNIVELQLQGDDANKLQEFPLCARQARSNKGLITK